MRGYILTLGSQELPFGFGVLRVNQTSRMYLDLIHVNSITAKSHNHLLPVTGGVGAIGGRKPKNIRTVLLQQRVLAVEVCSISTSRENDRAILSVGLALMNEIETGDNVALAVDLGNTSLLDDLYSVGLSLGELLELLHQGVGDGHTGELGIVTTVCTGL